MSTQSMVVALFGIAVIGYIIDQAVAKSSSFNGQGKIDVGALHFEGGFEFNT